MDYMRRRDFFKKSQQKKYKTGSYKNPYFKNQKELLSTSTIMLSLFIVFFTAGVVLFLLFHPMFLMSRIHVIGLDQIDRTIFTEFLQKNVQRNRFLFRPQELSERLNESFVFRDIQMNKNGNYLEVRLVERTSQLIWKTGLNAFVVDLDGIVIREVLTDELDHLLAILPLFVDRNEVRVGVGDTVLTRQETDAVFRFHEHLQKQGIHFSSTEFDRLAGKWVGVLTDNGYHILFDVSSDIDVQAQRLEVLLKEKVPDQAKLEYIDLRFGDHIYYK